MAKEILSAFFIVVFVENAYFQLIPLLIMSASNGAFLYAKRPFKRAFKNSFQLFTESLYFILYLGFLMIHLTQNSLTFKQRHWYLGLTMIVIICLILVTNIVFGFYETYLEIKDARQRKKRLNRISDKENQVAINKEKIAESKLQLQHESENQNLEDSKLGLVENGKVQAQG